MVRTSLLIAVLPLVHALFIPHDLPGLNPFSSNPTPPELDDPQLVGAVATTNLNEDDEGLKSHIIKWWNSVTTGEVHKGHGGKKPQGTDCARKGKHGKGKHGKKHHGKRIGAKERGHARKGKCLSETGEKVKCIDRSDIRVGGSRVPKVASDINVEVDSRKGMADVIVPTSALPIEDKYIVVFKDDVSPEDVSIHLSWVEATHLEHVESMLLSGLEVPLLFEDAGLTKVFDIGPSFRGYAGTFLPETLESIRKHPAVDYIERDSKVTILNSEVENGAPWGLARVSHRKALSLGTFNKYLYDDEGGEGVTAYVVDTGIYIDHKDFGGRAKWGKTIPVGDVDKDAHGHGSHCAGTIGGKKYGVSKKANLVAVKVLGSDGSGTMSDVIGGVEYVVTSHKKDMKDNKKHKGSTANMSLGGGKSPSLEVAVSAAVKQGVHFAVAAGNENQDACNVSPAGAKEPVTVGATALGDDRAYFSNYGKCVDIFAPGVNILSVGIASPDATQVMSGTSMASPHVCGLLTYFLSLQPSSDSEFATRGAITPEQLKKNLISFGTQGIITDLDTESPNVLSFNGGGKDITALWEGGEQADEPLKEQNDFPIDFAKVGEAILEDFSQVADYAENLFGDLRAALGVSTA